MPEAYFARRDVGCQNKPAKEKGVDRWIVTLPEVGCDRAVLEAIPPQQGLQPSH